MRRRRCRWRPGRAGRSTRWPPAWGSAGSAALFLGEDALDARVGDEGCEVSVLAGREPWAPEVPVVLPCAVVAVDGDGADVAVGSQGVVVRLLPADLVPPGAERPV